MFKLKMLMGSLLENRQSTINTSPAHGKKKCYSISQLQGSLKLWFIILASFNRLVIWFDCLEKKVCLQWQKVLCILENGEAKDDFVYWT